MKRELAIVLVSGGMDSCLTAAIAQQSNVLAFLHMNYGQKTENREIKAFHAIADYYGVQKKLVVDVKHFTQIGGSSLTDDRIKIGKADLQNESIPNSYVPFRNANILAIATSWAEIIEAKKIYIGAVEEDSSGYPDCRESFFRSFEKVISEGTRPETRIQIDTPLIKLSKKEIVEAAFELNAPLHLTWSCYQNEDKACGICDSCALRLRGFELAGKEDPIIYKTRPSYLDDKY
jgi:7-cyano-7-deazaguanine synthase